MMPPRRDLASEQAGAGSGTASTPATAGTEVVMRRLVSLVALSTMIAALLVAGGLGTGLLTVAPTAAQQEIVVIEHASSDAVVDLGEEGDSVGDTLVFSNEVYDSEDANVVGSDQGSCTRTKKGEAWECSYTVTLDDGSIVVQGALYDDGRDTTLAITGGTGDYSGASGEMDLKVRDGGDKYEFTFKLN
jgi:allene oxide cyclase